jgi:copper chaperone CopZ
MRSFSLIFGTAILSGLFLAGWAVAAEPQAKSERFTYRVLGMFSRDREADLREVFKGFADLTLVAVNFDDAEITVEFVPAKAFPGAKPEQLVERVDQRVREATRHTFSVKPRRTVAPEKLEQVVIPVSGCDCKACCLAAYEAVAVLDGVEQATASFREGRVTARIDPTKTDRAKLEEALRKRGVGVGKP